MSGNDAQIPSRLYMIIGVAIIMLTLYNMLDRYLTHLEKNAVKVVDHAKD